MDDQNQASDDNQMPASGFVPPEPDDSPATLTDEHDHSSPQDTSTSPSDSLVDIKIKAINQLTPLVKHLDQSAEERFKTTLMMIQVSDNQELIKDAFEAAEQITDEKAKAQALLDIVNEINYFTKQAE